LALVNSTTAADDLPSDLSLTVTSPAVSAFAAVEVCTHTEYIEGMLESEYEPGPARVCGFYEERGLRRRRHIICYIRVYKTSNILTLQATSNYTPHTSYLEVNRHIIVGPADGAGTCAVRLAKMQIIIKSVRSGGADKQSSVQFGHSRHPRGIVESNQCLSGNITQAGLIRSDGTSLAAAVFVLREGPSFPANTKSLGIVQTK
jgi:hypothetical protein